MLDIAILRLIWWALIGIILIGFALTDGFDFGVAALMPFITRNEKDREMIVHSIAPFWEGNQVWIILGAGAIFAAWPFVYAVAFSGFYFPILLLLLTMGISRPVSIKYRSKVPNPYWQLVWDSIFFIGGLIPALLFGLLVGNVLKGAPFHFDQTLRIYYDGGLFDLFTPFPILCALTSLFMLMMHGGLYLAMKTENPLRKRAMNAARIAAFGFAVCYICGGVALLNVKGLHIEKGGDWYGYSNPLLKTVIGQSGAWLHHYFTYPWLWLIPGTAIVGALLVIITAPWKESKLAFLASGLSISSVISSVGISLYPFILPSSTSPNSSLLIWDASSSELTLLIMLIATIIFLPLIILYTGWVYKALSGKIEH